MGTADRRYRGADDADWRGEGGGFRRALRRIFIEGDGFMTWSLPLYTLWGVRVRVHLLYLLVVAVQLLKAIQPGSIGIWYTVFTLSCGFVLVLLHEYGHILACRWVRGEADEILMWPLGGLAFCRPPHDWRSNLITTLGGPAVNVVIGVLLGGVLLGLGAGWRMLVFNPFDMWGAAKTDGWFNSPAAYWKTALYAGFVANTYLLLFNVTLVMFPMDAARIVQELLWRRMGYRRSMQIATNVGLVAAVLVGAAALFMEQMTLMGIALFCGFTCYSEKQKLLMVDDPYADVLERSEIAGRDDDSERFQQALKRQEQERAAQAEVDRILAKIAASGMSSLSAKEKRVLREATERQRSGGR